MCHIYHTIKISFKDYRCIRKNSKPYISLWCPIKNFRGSTRNAKKLYNNVLSDKAKNISDVLDEFSSLAEKYKNSENPNEFNLETLDLFLKYKITTKENVEKLKESGKIKIDGLDELLKKYEMQTT